MSFLDALFGKKPEAAPEPAEKKPDRFRADAAAFAARCRMWGELPGGGDGPRVAVVVSPWISTPVPFFSMECALALRHAGLRPSLIWDSVEIVGNVPNKKHVEVISGVFPELPPDIEVIDVSNSGMRPDDRDAERARRIVYENAVRNVRGEANVADFIAAHPQAEADTRAHLARIRHALTAGRFDWLLTPGGIFGVSAVYVEMARELGLPFSTFDSGPGRLRLSHDGVAAHLADLPRTFEIVNLELSVAEKARAMSLAREELAKRTEARDDRGFQVAGATGASERCDVLIPLNIRWDSAALGRQRLFDSVEASIAAVLDWVEARPDVTICIRQHPNERRDHLRGSDNFEGLSGRLERLGERARWIGAAEAVNTYDLIRAAKVILPHTSTVGVEAALMGKPVVLSTRVYYDGFSFVWNPGTREEFFALIGKALAGELEVTPEAGDEAAMVYFLTQQCAVMRTRFTPQNDDFPQWSATPPAALWAEPEPLDFLTALRTREPLAALRARRFLG